jgi:4-carboxymuconolactone decarboxylase
MAKDDERQPAPSRREALEPLAAGVLSALAADAAMAAPGDIDPQSGNRLPLPRREDLDEPARRIYDQVVDPNGGTIRGLRGPSGIHLHSPKLAVLMRPLNNYLRNGTGFSGRVREVAILAAARATDSQFEWAAHEVIARKEGVPDAAIDAIKHRKPTRGLEENDALVIDLCRASFERRRVPAELYARALATFGEAQIVDLVVLMGYYVMTAGLLAAFDMQLYPGQEPSLPVP